jgi:hypothetical protein
MARSGQERAFTSDSFRVHGHDGCSTLPADALTLARRSAPGRNKVGVPCVCMFEGTRGRWHTEQMDSSKPSPKPNQRLRLVVAGLGAFVGCLQTGQLLHWSFPLTLAVAIALCGAAWAVNLLIRRRQGGKRN